MAASTRMHMVLIMGIQIEASKLLEAGPSGVFPPALVDVVGFL